VVDGFYGIKQVDIGSGTGKVTPIYKSEPSPTGGQLVVDDIALDEGGGSKGGHVFYMTILTNKRSMDDLNMGLVENESSGKIVKYEADSRRSTVLLEGLTFPNGIELNDAKDGLIFLESGTRRVLKLYIKGPKTGQKEVLIETLPGIPDNIRRSSSKTETYWIALFSAKNASSPGLLTDGLADKPLLRKCLFRFTFHLGSGLEWLGHTFNYVPLKEIGFGLKTFHIPIKLTKEYGMVLEMDNKGTILRSLHSPDASTTTLSEVRDVVEAKTGKRVLYLGSFYNDYLGKLVLSK
jgi:hypothetical protein